MRAAARIRAFLPPLRAVGNAAVLSAVFCAGARADRNILAPRGLVVPAGVARIEFAAMADGPKNNFEWVSGGVPALLPGIEVEVERDDLNRRRDATFSLQYSFTGNAFSDLAPALSVGLRDVLDQGREGRAFFAAATKTFRLSERQEKFLRYWRLDLGYGTAHMGGGFVGIEGRFTAGFTVSAEYLARRVNASIAAPIGKTAALKVYSLNRDVYYGASLRISL